MYALLMYCKVQVNLSLKIDLSFDFLTVFFHNRAFNSINRVKIHCLGLVKNDS